MKKAGISLGVVLAVGALWIAGAWYSGIQVERKIQHYVSQTNELMAKRAPHSSVSYSLKEYQRGWFSSQFQMVAEFSQNPFYDTGLGTLSTDSGPLRLVSHTNLEHGPLPFSRLGQLKFMPVVAALQDTVEEAGTSPSLFEFFETRTFYTGHWVLEYGGKFEGEYRLSPLTVKGHLFDLSVTDMTLSVRGDIDLAEATEGKASFSTLVFTEKNRALKTELKGMQADISIGPPTKEGYPQFDKFHYRFDEVKISLPAEKHSLYIKALDVVFGRQLDQEKIFYSGNIAVSSEVTELNDLDLGSQKVNLTYKNIHAETLYAASDLYQKNLLELREQGSPAEGKSPVDKEFAKSMTKLLNYHPEVSITPLHWKNSAGESNYQLNLVLQPIKKSSIGAAENILSMINKLDMKLELHTPMLQELMAGIALLSHKADSLEEAQQQAKQSILMLKMAGQGYDLFRPEGDHLYTHLQFADNTITLNGKKMPLSRFIGTPH